MRTLTGDAALVALPSLAASGIAAAAGGRLLAAAPADSWYANGFAFLPVYLLLGALATALLHILFRGLLERRTVAISMGRTMFTFLAGMTVAALLLADPPLAVAVAAAAVGAAFTLKLIREWPSPGTRPGWRRRIAWLRPRPAQPDH
jgi:hypothetical protein